VPQSQMLTSSQGLSVPWRLTRHLWSLVVLSICVCNEAKSADRLVIISPHRKSIQNEFIPAFRRWYQDRFRSDVEVEWLDQGGSHDDIKFIKARFAANPKTAAIDVFWGGGTTVHTELANKRLAETINLEPGLKAQIPASAGGIPLSNREGTYIAQALSSFGIFYNRRILELERLPEPITWEVLADSRMNGKIVLTDARKSGTASVMNHVILSSLGWERGFDIITAMAANARQFTQSSSDVIKFVVAGEAAATLAIDFYALAKIGDLGQKNLGFSLPEGKTIIEGDPVSILKGAPNRVVADRFISYILSPEGQLLLVLPKGAAGGPKFETLGRMAVNTEAYKLSEGRRVISMNPYTARGFLPYDAERQAKLRAILDDLTGSLLIDNHKDLRLAWAQILKSGSPKDRLRGLSSPPIDEKELERLAPRWEDAKFRNQTINKWVEFARIKYQKIIERR
jgi:ABC-type Fe3+ transport system substrate-binding protein